MAYLVYQSLATWESHEVRASEVCIHVDTRET